jgi:hypothetical protein
MRLLLRSLRPPVLVTLLALLLGGCGAAAAPRLDVVQMLSEHLIGQSLTISSASVHPLTATAPFSQHHFHQRLVVERLDIPRDPALAPSPALRAVAAQILSTTIAGQHVVIVIPRHSLHRAILFEHGSGETADLDIDVPPSAPTIADLVGAGYTWAESDAGFNNWGDRASLDDDVAVARWLRANGDLVIDIGGDSMGGLDATQLIPRLHPQAVFELFPVCNERTVVDEFGRLMQRADAPLRRLSPVAMDGVRGLPMLFTASPEDTVVSKATNANVCAREASAAGALVREVTTRGEHGNSSNWRPGRLIDFLDAAASGHFSTSAFWRRTL